MRRVGTIPDHTDHLTILSLQGIPLGTAVPDYPPDPPSFKILRKQEIQENEFPCTDLIIWLVEKVTNKNDLWVNIQKFSPEVICQLSCI